jgi:hypothetical protein
MIAASKTNLLLADVLLVIALVLIYATDGLKQYPIILAPLLIIAFASCVIRHINYYKLTKKFY